MALTLRADGTGAAFLVNSTWWNDYYNLLTGNMTDQAVTLKYAPSSNPGGIPTLKLLSNTGTPLLLGLKPDGATQAFKFDENGNLSGPAGQGIPITRNNAATSVPVYTGTNTPTNPPTGAIWVKA